MNRSHSSATGLSAIRGTLIFTDGSVVSPASLISSTPCGKSIAVMFIAWALASDTMLTTNCPVSRILFPVSFASPGLRPPIPMITSGGSPEIALKNENGAALVTPLASCVTTQATGRGPTVDTSSL